MATIQALCTNTWLRIGHGSMTSVKWLTKFLGGSSDRWYWSGDAFPPASFCVRALVHDGLAVPPFDLHGDGDGRLREFGLNADMWREWVAAVLRQRVNMGDCARTLGTPDARGPLLEQVRAAAEVLRVPGSCCPGPDELRVRLNDLFADYASAGEEWKWRISDAPRLHGSSRQQRVLWKADAVPRSPRDALGVPCRIHRARGHATAADVVPHRAEANPRGLWASGGGRCDRPRRGPLSIRLQPRQQDRRETR